FERWNSFSATNASLNEAKLTYIKLNIQTPCPPRSAVPVNQGCCGRLFHSQHLDRLRSWMRLAQLCRGKLSSPAPAPQEKFFALATARFKDGQRGEKRWSPCISTASRFTPTSPSAKSSVGVVFLKARILGGSIFAILTHTFYGRDT
ncbi:MAG TPA: hypothetical protein VFR76_05590, partial [Verrucomicrobiae bacterium]|nr:hypothetical protein [Verrucomicrobiae bacterium]